MIRVQSQGLCNMDHTIYPSFDHTSPPLGDYVQPDCVLRFSVRLEKENVKNVRFKKNLQKNKTV